MKKNLRFSQTTTISAILLLTLSLFSAPALSDDIAYNTSWTINIINDETSTTKTFTIGDLLAMPKSSVSAELYCFGVFVISGNWGGVSLGQLCTAAQIETQSDYIILDFLASDSYAVSLNYAKSEKPQWENLIIAYELDGTPIAESLRLILPGVNGEQWIAWITQIKITQINQTTTPSPSSPPPTQPSQTPKATSPSTQTPLPTLVQPENPASPLPTMPAESENNSNLQTTDSNENAASSDHLLILVIVFVALTIGVGSFIFWKKKGYL
jgi:DMSO/TMAO reductase YedYZ molybdopterin-dependent catalytic subunit